MATILRDWNWAGESRFADNAANQVTVAQNTDGRLEMFYIGTNDGLYHNWQTAPNSGWAGETPFSGDSAKQITVGQNADGRLEMFYVGTNNNLYHNWQTAPGQGWAGEFEFPGDSAKQITVVQNADGRLEIFYVGTNSNIYHNWQTAPNQGWAGEFEFPGDSAQQIAVGRNADGRLEMFYVGTNNKLYHNWQVAPGQGWAGEFEFVGDSALQIAVAQNADGRLEIFYVGTNYGLYHNWQVSPGGGWAGETRFPGCSANQVVVGRNADGRLEIFYVGRDNALYHNWQVTPNGGWAGEFGFTNVGAQQVAVGQNKDGRLEVFYVGLNTGLYHNWQNVPGGGWTDAAGGSVSTPSSGLGSNSNYLLDSGCNSLTDVAITIVVTQDIVLQSNSQPQPGSSSLSGFTFQLNCYSPKNETSAWQQYVIGLYGSEIRCQINNWQSLTTFLINQSNHLASLPTSKIPAGYQLRITLQNDSSGNITAATFSAADNQGSDLGNSSTVLSSLSGVTSVDLSPIIAFEVNLVGPGNSESAVLSTGAGSILYEASSILSVLSATPSCAEVGYITAETANSFYGAMTAGPSNFFSQSFSTSTGTPMIRKQGKLRPRLTFPKR